MGLGVGQGRPLADWTDCFQSGPAPKGAPRYAYQLNFSRCCMGSAGAGPKVFLSVRSISNENQSELRVFERPASS